MGGNNTHTHPQQINQSLQGNPQQNIFMVNNSGYNRSRSSKNNQIFQGPFEQHQPMSATHGRGYSVDIGSQKYPTAKQMSSKHGNMMIKSHNDGVSSFTKGASIT